MIKKRARPKAKRASHSFADPRSSNGTEANAPNGKAPPKRGQSNTVFAACQQKDYRVGDHAQAQSRNGSEPKSSLLLDERFGVWQPSVATAIGLNGAIVLQQLHYRLTKTDHGRVHAGHRWIFNTYEEWQKNDFPFWSTRTIQRVLLELETEKLIVTCRPEGRDSRRKYYRIDYGVLDKAVGVGASRTRTQERAKLACSNVPKVDVPLITNTSHTNTSPITPLTPHGGAGSPLTGSTKPLPIPENQSATKAQLPDASAGQDWRAGKRPLRRLRINGLERLRERIVNEINELYRRDPDGTKQQRLELRQRIKEVETEWERKTKRSADELRLRHAAERSQREHEAIKNEPIFPVETTIALNSWVADQRNGHRPNPDQEHRNGHGEKGYVLRGKFLSKAQALLRGEQNPELIVQFRKAIRKDGKVITLQPNGAMIGQRFGRLIEQEQRDNWRKNHE
jgi:hypothetical protein